MVSIGNLVFKKCATSSVTFLITVSDWIQSKIQTHEYVYYRITVSDWIKCKIQPHEYVYYS